MPATLVSFKVTLSDLIREIGELGARSPAVKTDVRGWINRAQRAVAQRHNWTFLHSIVDVAIASNATSATISTRFKALSEEPNPVTYTAPTAQFPVPVTIKSRGELDGMTPGFDNRIVNASGYWSPFVLFLENNAGAWTLNRPQGYTHTENSTYHVSCYLFPVDLSAGTDSNAITTDGELSEAIVAWVISKALLAEDYTDPKGMAARQDYEARIKTAIAQDAQRRLTGRAFRM